LTTDNKVPQKDKVAPVSKTIGKQTLRKDRFTIDINADWEILEEPIMVLPLPLRANM
jgi:hypothetical protein